MRVLGFCGKAYAGKTTADQFLYNDVRMSRIIPMAERLKEIAKMLGWDGKKDERGRKLLQTLGTECTREYDPDFWVKEWEKKVFQEIENAPLDLVLVDDIRFDNEAKKILDMGGYVILIGREGFNGVDDHVSEKGISNYLINRVLVNDGDLKMYEKAVKRLYSDLPWS